jgi:hypothetical protein
VECVGRWAGAFVGVLRVAFEVSVSVVVFEEWTLDAMVGELGLRALG